MCFAFFPALPSNPESLSFSLCLLRKEKVFFCVSKSPWRTFPFSFNVDGESSSFSSLTKVEKDDFDSNRPFPTDSKDDAESLGTSNRDMVVYTQLLFDQRERQQGEVATVEQRIDPFSSSDFAVNETSPSVNVTKYKST